MSKVLVVDDNKDLLEFVCLLLKINKFDVRPASKKADVLELLDSFHPDIILMDVMLSGYDGRELCKEIKQKNRNIPIILLSASPNKLKNYTACEADDIIEKPFDISNVLEKINSLIV